jgi:hypothetical protein
MNHERASSIPLPFIIHHFDFFPTLTSPLPSR